jgi:hypothetical protein
MTRAVRASVLAMTVQLTIIDDAVAHYGARVIIKVSATDKHTSKRAILYVGIGRAIHISHAHGRRHRPSKVIVEVFKLDSTKEIVVGSKFAFPNNSSVGAPFNTIDNAGAISFEVTIMQEHRLAASGREDAHMMVAPSPSNSTTYYSEPADLDAPVSRRSNQNDAVNAGTVRDGNAANRFARQMNRFADIYSRGPGISTVGDLHDGARPGCVNCSLGIPGRAVASINAISQVGESDSRKGHGKQKPNKKRDYLHDLTILTEQIGVSGSGDLANLLPGILVGSKIRYLAASGVQS